MKIGLFGGSFDPIHNGHLHLAREFAHRLSLDKVLFMPTFVPPHKLRSDMAKASDRLEMCRLAVSGEPLFAVSDLEIRRGGASFTVNTLELLSQEFPGAAWYLITGADMFLTLGSWHRFSDIARMAVLCTAPRDGVPLAQLRDYAAKLQETGAQCVVEDIEELAVSSTDIRSRVKSHQPMDALVPSAVEEYIQSHGLYNTDAHATASDNCEAQNALYEQYVEILRGRLSPKRFRHSLAVADRAVELARRYGADENKANVAGLLHDIMKDAGHTAQLQILSDFGIILSNAEKASPGCWHAIAGAAFMQHILGIQDEDILNAVRYHTTGRAGMTVLEEIIYLADFTSSDRDYTDVDVMRRLSETAIAPAMDYALTYTIRDLLEKSAVIHPDSLHAYNERMAAKQKGGEHHAK